mmetsp:Transcript_8333/g.25036  ORF Transcript_8333/g.25036 Transcript_8333/m.25036 type:complete len:282 (+) Transcript_8333:277-1122(+)
MPAVSDLRLAQAAVAAAGRLRGVTAKRLGPKEILGALVHPPPVVGLEALPEASAGVGAIRAPAVVALRETPAVALREAALRDWPALYKKQTSWADYVFTKQPLFGERPIVLAAPPTEDEAYLAHAATLEGAPFVCVPDIEGFARAAGCSEVAADAADPAEAAERAGASLEALNLHANFVQCVAAEAGVLGYRRVLGVAAGEATPDVVEALGALAADLVTEEGEADEGAAERAMETQGALLRSCAVFSCGMSGETFDLAPAGTTLGLTPSAAAGSGSKESGK